MTLQYLMDENVDPVYINQLRRRYADLVVWAIGEPDTQPRETLDPEILIWCEANNFILVTNNRISMPVHLAEHLDLQFYCCHNFKNSRKLILIFSFETFSTLKNIQ